MDEPTPGGVATAPQPMRRFDWERLVLRAHLPKHIKATALAMAVFASSDGSNVRPGLELIGDALDDSETTAGKSVNTLVSFGLLTLETKGGGTNGAGHTSVYRLSSPGEALLMRLDPDWNRVIPRAKGRTPTNRPSGRPRDPKPGSARPPADRPEVGFVSQVRPDPKSASDGVVDRPEVQDAPTRSGASSDLKPGSDYQGDQPLTRTTRGVALGGERHLTLIRSDDTEDVDHTVVVEPEPAEPPAPALCPVPDVSPEQYAEAYNRLSVLPDYGTALLAQAMAEFSDEGRRDVPATVLAVRAAQIAARPAPRSA